MQPELPGHGAELLLGGLVECDPSHPASLANGLVRFLQRPRLLGPVSVHVDDVVHDHGLIIRLSGRRLGRRDVGKRSGAESLFAFRNHASWAVCSGDTTGPVVATDPASVYADCDNGAVLQRAPRRGRDDGAAGYRVLGVGGAMPIRTSRVVGHEEHLTVIADVLRSRATD